jgi:hypothetical protein
MEKKIFEEKILILQRKLEDLLNSDDELRAKASRGECANTDENFFLTLTTTHSQKKERERKKERSEEEMESQKCE